MKWVRRPRTTPRSIPAVCGSATLCSHVPIDTRVVNLTISATKFVPPHGANRKRENNPVPRATLTNPRCLTPATQQRGHLEVRVLDAALATGLPAPEKPPEVSVEFTEEVMDIEKVIG